MNSISFHAEKCWRLIVQFVWIPLITSFNCKACLIRIAAAHVLLQALHLYSIYVWSHIPVKIVSGDTYITEFSAYACSLWISDGLLWSTRLKKCENACVRNLWWKFWRVEKYFQNSSWQHKSIWSVLFQNEAIQWMWRWCWWRTRNTLVRHE